MRHGSISQKNVYLRKEGFELGLMDYSNSSVKTIAFTHLNEPLFAHPIIIKGSLKAIV